MKHHQQHLKANGGNQEIEQQQCNKKIKQQHKEMENIFTPYPSKLLFTGVRTTVVHQSKTHQQHPEAREMPVA